MKRLLEKFTQRLETSGLVEAGGALFGMADDCIVWNRDDPVRQTLAPLFSSLNINAVLFARPAMPYRPIIDFLAEREKNGLILPKDCETRTFLHDLPTTLSLEPETIFARLKTRKSIIIPGQGVVTTGSISPEQALVTFSSVCFACFVKFFTDFLEHARSKTVSEREVEVFRTAAPWAAKPVPAPKGLMRGPFNNEKEILMAMVEAGKWVVDAGLVDSSFGNLSYLSDGIIYISQTGAFLDELSECIDACPIDGSKCTGITASSELPAHLKILSETKNRSVLHGHPLFSVIMSMVCDIEDCKKKGECHRACPYDRSVCGIPIVPGEVGSGAYGLCNTVACKMGPNGVIVYGHGVFAAGRDDFKYPARCLAEIENNCKKEYFRRIEEYAPIAPPGKRPCMPKSPCSPNKT